MTLNKEAKDLYYACSDMENHIYFISSRNDVSKNGIKYYLKCLKEAIEKLEKSGWLESEVNNDDITQMTLFGKDIPVEKLPKDKGKGSGKKTPTMQQLWGTIPGKTCKTCKHCESHGWGHTNRWYKCEIWSTMFRGSSSASDIRLKNTACKKYEEETE